MMTLSNCTVTDSDGLVELEHAVVIASGESPNATIRISVPDRAARKYRLHDRILHASIQEAGKSWTIEGESEQLRNEVGTVDTLMKLKVVAKGGCAGCR